MQHRRRGLALVCAAAALTGCATTVTVAPEAQALSAHIATIVELPVDLAFGLPAEQARVQRRSGDTLIALTGGHAVLAEELPLRADRALTDDEVRQGIKQTGEDPATALTFSIVASRSKRNVTNASAIPGFQLGRRMVVDYMVRVEVRQPGRADVIGSVDAVSVSEPNEGEIGPKGESLGVQKAVDEALAKAVRTFAPGLASRAEQVAIAEVPLAVEGSPLKRLQAVSDLYPELTIDQIQTLATSRERMMVLRPGPLAAMGLSPGDLLSPPPGKPLTSRGALARSVARGDALVLVVARGGQRYLLTERARPTNVASAQ